MIENKPPVLIFTQGDVYSISGNNNIQAISGSINGNDNQNIHCNININIGSIPKSDFLTEAFGKLTFSHRTKVLTLVAKLLIEQENET